MATLAKRRADQETSVATMGFPPIAPRVSPMLRQRNRMIGLMLASVAALMFIAIVTMAVLFHLAEAHHVLKTF